MDNKTVLRTKAKNIRKSLSICEISQKAVERIRNHSFYKNAKNVLIFYPMKYEINLLELLSDSKDFYLPRVCGSKLEVCSYRVNDELNISDFNVLEPCSEAVDAKVLDLIIVPALMGDKNGYRLGYGGGFYDRFLARKNVNYKTLSIISKKLFVEVLPIDEFDVKIDEFIVV